MVSMDLSLYHIHVCHCEQRGGCPGQSDPRPSTLGVAFSLVQPVCCVHYCSFGLFGFIGSLSAERNKRDKLQTDQTNQTVSALTLASGHPSARRSGVLAIRHKLFTP